METFTYATKMNGEHLSRIAQKGTAQCWDDYMIFLSNIYRTFFEEVAILEAYSRDDTQSSEDHAHGARLRELFLSHGKDYYNEYIKFEKNQRDGTIPTNLIQFEI